MMRVSVVGESPVLTEYEWKGAVNWYAEHLLGKRMADRCSVFLELAPYMRGHAGSISCTDWRRRRSFLVRIQTGGFGRRKQLYTLGHEMTHLRQIVAGELTVRLGNIVWRCDRQIPGECPWETEAYEAERVLYREFMTR